MNGNRPLLSCLGGTKKLNRYIGGILLKNGCIVGPYIDQNARWSVDPEYPSVFLIIHPVKSE